LHPPELISPAKNPTSASFAHWPTLNGWKSCCFACWKAGLTVSIAEMGTPHLAKQGRTDGCKVREAML